ncbi:hypothetical protein [Candidatus Phytoplasma gossypii]|uniref:HNH endonuclease n=1 Tax=Candidatus Phytoplasma gossypii TaxID=2982629 RepID=UPI002FE104CB
MGENSKDEKLQRRRNDQNSHQFQSLLKGRTRLTEQKCEVGQSENQSLEIHHVGTIRDFQWKSIMNKKTTVICQVCHRGSTNKRYWNI